MALMLRYARDPGPRRSRVHERHLEGRHVDGDRSRRARLGRGVVRGLRLAPVRPDARPRHVLGLVHARVRLGRRGRELGAAGSSLRPRAVDAGPPRGGAGRPPVRPSTGAGAAIAAVAAARALSCSLSGVNRRASRCGDARPPPRAVGRAGGARRLPPRPGSARDATASIGGLVVASGLSVSGDGFAAPSRAPGTGRPGAPGAAADDARSELGGLNSPARPARPGAAAPRRPLAALAAAG